MHMHTVKSNDLSPANYKVRTYTVHSICNYIHTSLKYISDSTGLQCLHTAPDRVSLHVNISVYESI